ncbi:MAG TPA: DHH family phosphoesterase [Candidatus Methylomirabilis sp.]|nr:DHH family phosphoesterase [Candidatus Methylomirabilis sp.]
MTDALQAVLEEAARRLRAARAESALLVHHNDADGLTSAALLSMALEAVGCAVQRLAVEKIFPEVLAAIHARGAPLIVYADLAGQNAGAIAALADGETCTVILDHHRPDPIQAPQVFVVNPELVGLSGDLDSSASALAYQVLRRLVPPGGRYADLGVLGALGDGQVVDGKLRGANGVAMRDAEAGGSIRRVAEDVRMATFSRFDGRPGAALAADLTRLGSVGYYRGGPALALGACRGGFDDRVRACLRELGALETERYAAVEARLRRGGLRRVGRVQWFDVEDGFVPMGVKCVGTFCERVAAAEWADPGSYVVGMQPLPGEIPGLGRFEWDLRKVSVRVSAGLAREVLAGRSPDLMRLVPAACEAAAGFADGCHRLTAAATIPGAATGQFIQALARAADAG